MEIFAPFAGVVRFCVADGETVAVGTQLAVVEAMKLEAPVLSPISGRVLRREREDFLDVLGGDLLVEIV